MKKNRIQPHPTLAMRLNDVDKTALRDLASSQNRSQTDTIRVLVREGRLNLSELKIRAASYPRTKPTGRPKTH